MCFSTEAELPSIAHPSRFARMPITVSMHEASEVASVSVGENDSPLPWLSSGASLTSVAPEGA